MKSNHLFLAGLALGGIGLAAVSQCASVRRSSFCLRPVDRPRPTWQPLGADPSASGNEKTLPGAPKLVKIDLATNKVTRIIPVGEDVALQGSYLNDNRFSPDGWVGYSTDTDVRRPIIVLDLDTGSGLAAILS